MSLDISNITSMISIRDGITLERYDVTDCRYVRGFGRGEEYWELLISKYVHDAERKAILLGLSEAKYSYYIRTTDKKLMQSILDIISWEDDTSGKEV